MGDNAESSFEPLPQRPRRSFGVKSRTAVESGDQPVDATSAAISGAGEGHPVQGEGRQQSEGGMQAARCAIGVESHESIGIADGCGYNEAIQYVGEVSVTSCQ